MVTHTRQMSNGNINSRQLFYTSILNFGHTTYRTKLLSSGRVSLKAIERSPKEVLNIISFSTETNQLPQLYKKYFGSVRVGEKYKKKRRMEVIARLTEQLSTSAV